MTKVVMVILLYAYPGGYDHPLLTKMDSMTECNAIKAALIQKFPQVDSGWAHGPSGIVPETIFCIEYKE